MKRSLPFFIILILIYGSVALIAPQLGDPQIEKLLKTKFNSVLILYIGSFFYFCFIFWMFEVGVHRIRKILSKILRVDIKEVHIISDRIESMDVRDMSYVGWDFTGKPYLAFIIFPIEALVYGGSVIVPIAIAALWGYLEFQ